MNLPVAINQGPAQALGAFAAVPAQDPDIIIAYSSTRLRIDFINTRTRSKVQKNR